MSFDDGWDSSDDDGGKVDNEVRKLTLKRRGRRYDTDEEVEDESPLTLSHADEEVSRASSPAHTVSTEEGHRSRR